MKKRLFAIMLVIALIVSCVAVLAACGEKPEPTPDPTPEVKKHTVKVYNGRDLLDTLEVEDGKTIPAGYKPKDIADKIFVGLYEDSEYQDAFDASKPITKNINIYAYYRNAVAAPDTRVWHAIGGGSGDMQQSGWNENVDGILTLTKAADKNEFSIEIKMYAGDQIQFVFEQDSIWNLQHGVGYFEGYTATPEGEYEGECKIGDKVCFVATGGYGDSPNGWNAVCAPGADGIYRFTLVTDPDDNNADVVKFELVEAIKPLDKTCELYVRGYMNGWTAAEEVDGEKVGIAEYKMTAKDVNGLGEGVWYYVLNVTEIGTTPEGAEAAIAKVEFKAWSLIGDKWYGKLDDGKAGDPADNFTITENGTYVLVIDTVNATYKLEKAAYRVTGTFNGKAWADGDAQRAEGYVPNNTMTKVDVASGEKYTYTLTVTATNMTAEWVGKDCAGSIAAIKVELCAAGITVKEWNNVTDSDNVVLANNNIHIKAAGSYIVSLTIDEEGNGKVDVAAAPAAPAFEAPAAAAADAPEGWEALDLTGLGSWGGLIVSKSGNGAVIYHTAEVTARYANSNAGYDWSVANNRVRLVIKNEYTAAAYVKAGVQNASYACILASATIDGEAAADIVNGVYVTLEGGATVTIEMLVDLAKDPVNLFIAINSEEAIGENAPIGCVSVKAFYQATGEVPVAPEMDEHEITGTQAFGFGGESDARTHNDTLYYWYVQDVSWNCGAVVDLATHSYEDGVITLGYSGGDRAFSVQVFYMNSELTEGTRATLKLKIKATADLDVAIQGRNYSLVANEAKEIELTYTVSAKATDNELSDLDIQLNGHEGEVVVTISDIVWETPKAAAEGGETGGETGTPGETPETPATPGEGGETPATPGEGGDTPATGDDGDKTPETPAGGESGETPAGGESGDAE